MARSERLKNLLVLLERLRLDGLFISSLPNIRYISGFTGSWAACLVSPRRRILFIDSRYQLQAEREVEGFRILTVTSSGLFSALCVHARTLRLRELGFEAHALSYASYQLLKRALKGVCSIHAAPPLVEKIRMVKSREEILRLKKLAHMTDAVLSQCRGHVSAGMTERELGALLESIARDAGADGIAFPSIVASGSNSAMPHYRSGGGRLRNGSPLLIDFGLAQGGYNSDLTRTFHLGRVTRRYRGVYEVVLEAQQLAVQAIKAGVAASVVDFCARDYISSRGFQHCFGHSLGHGLGMEVHEAPRLNRDSDDILDEGMVCTVEPGIYIPGWGGVRIEDMVLVERDGCSVLTASPKGIEDSLL
ncbi:MAG: Xaa-Pro peptidase family protein [Candidatus Aureabacteria bacterium]|nr:Xaa-Pro peptidase family protein [Candidatus Auribacterota bacterium]